MCIRLIRYANPVRFDRATENGRTQPLRVTVETDEGHAVDVVMKVSAGAESSIEGLANEMLGSLLAADLGLPITEPFFVRLDAEFIASLTDIGVGARLNDSSPIAYASAHVGSQWHRWGVADKLPPEMYPLALGIMAFDGFIANNDRSPRNSNMLVKGPEWRLIDHESAFSFRMKFAPRCQPWLVGNLEMMRRYGEASEHIFARPLSNPNDLSYDNLRLSWASLSDERLAQYDACVPQEWDSVRPYVSEAIIHLKQVRDNIDACLEELKRVLS